mgnify:CR=1 FL=1
MKIKFLLNFFIFFFIANILKAEISTKRDVIRSLSSKPLSYLDLGIMNLKHDLDRSIDVILRKYTSNFLTNLISDRKKEITIDVTYSWRKSAVLASISVPIEKGLESKYHLTSTNKCRDIFNTVRNELLSGTIESTISSSRVASYLVSIFYPPSNQPFALQEDFRNTLSQLVILEIVLRPSLNYALKSNVSPMSCSGTLETLKNQVKIAHNYNQ